MLNRLANNFGEATAINIIRLYRVFEVLLFVGVLFASGGFTGYWIATQEAKQDRLDQASAHQEELKRTAGTYERSLSYLGGKTAEAAATATSAAQTAEGAAVTAQKAATKADVAVKQSTSSLANSNRLPEPTRDQINRSVQRANSAIK